MTFWLGVSRYWASLSPLLMNIHSFFLSQRRDYSALTKFLPPKNEYVISVRLSKVQMELYERYLNTFTNRGMDSGPGCNKGARLFSDYQNLMKIWTHPWVLRMDEIRQETKVVHPQRKKTKKLTHTINHIKREKNRGKFLFLIKICLISATVEMEQGR